MAYSSPMVNRACILMSMRRVPAAYGQDCSQMVGDWCLYRNPIVNQHSSFDEHKRDLGCA